MTIENIALPTVVTSEQEQIRPSNIVGDYEVLPKAYTDTGFIEVINQADISGLTLSWELYSEDNNYEEIPTETVEITF